MSEALRQAIEQAYLATLDAGAVSPQPALRHAHLRRLKEALRQGAPATGAHVQPTCHAQRPDPPSTLPALLNTHDA